MPHGFSHDDDVGAGNQTSAAACSLGRQQEDSQRAARCHELIKQASGSDRGLGVSRPVHP